jgi:hypothetical protein
VGFDNRPELLHHIAWVALALVIERYAPSPRLCGAAALLLSGIHKSAPQPGKAQRPAAFAQRSFIIFGDIAIAYHR